MSQQNGATKVPSDSMTAIDPPAAKHECSIEVSSTSVESNDDTQSLGVVPLSFKLASILMVSAIGFGSSWSGGITGAMKTALKKVSFTPPTSVLKHPNNLVQWVFSDSS
jgi:hypothetical protein